MDPVPYPAAGYPVRYWISEEEIRRMEYSAHWNDEEFEKKKVWFSPDGDFAKLKAHLEASGILRQLKDCLAAAKIGGVGADLACGVAWAAPHLLAAGPVDRLYCVEYSLHRLLKIAPRVLEHHGVGLDKAVLCVGSFYQLDLPSRSLDFVLLSEAFHHADDPSRLLREVGRVLKPDGVVLMIGEHVTQPKPLLHAKNAAKLILSRVLPSFIQDRLFGRRLEARRLFASTQELLRADTIAGDHYYLQSEYERMFGEEGLSFRRILTAGCPYQAFILSKTNRAY